MRRLASLIRKELRVTFRNYYLLIVVVVALIMVAVVNFVVPEDINNDKTLYIYASAAVNNKLKNEAGYQTLLQDAGQDNIFTSEQNMIEAVEKDSNSVGLALKEKEQQLSLEFIFQGYEGQGIRNTIILLVQKLLGGVQEGSVAYQTRFLNAALVDTKLPFNLEVVPLALALESALMGLFLIAAVMMIDIEEGTLTAYLITPGSLAAYLGAKVAAMLVYSWLSSLLITLLTVGWQVQWGALLLLITLSSIWASALGLLIASFYDNISQALIPSMIITMVLALPIVSYYAPSFAPSYIKVLPTYSLLFGLREAIFATGNESVLYQALSYAGGLALVGFGLCVKVFAYNLAKE